MFAFPKSWTPKSISHVLFSIVSPLSLWHTVDPGLMPMVNEEMNKLTGKKLLLGHQHCLLNWYTVRVTQWQMESFLKNERIKQKLDIIVIIVSQKNLL